MFEKISDVCKNLVYIAPVQLAAWTYTLNLTSVDAAKITQFYEGHLDKGPELVR